MTRDPFTITVYGIELDEQTVTITSTMTVKELRREVGADDAYVPQLLYDDRDGHTILDSNDMLVYEEAKDADRIFFGFPPGMPE